MSPRPVARRKWLPTGALPSAYLVGLALCLGLGCKAPPAATPARKPPLVTISKVASRDLPITLRAPLELRPIHSAEVGSKTLGYLDAVFVERGDLVKRGQILALVRPSDLPDQLEVARGALGSAQASVQLARNNFERAKNLAPSAVVSQAELQQARSALAVAEANDVVVQSQIKALAVRLGETKIVSPIAGVVASRRLDPGALVGPTGGSIVTVMRVDVLRAFVSIPEEASATVAAGQSAEVQLDAHAGQTFVAKVARVSPGLDPATRMLEAELQLSNERGTLRPGMYGHARLVLAVHQGALVVPTEAVVHGQARSYVYVHKDGVARLQPVKVGFDGDTFLEITSGLAAGQDVIVGGLALVSDGGAVRAVPANRPQ